MKISDAYKDRFLEDIESALPLNGATRPVQSPEQDQINPPGLAKMPPDIRINANPNKSL